MKCPKCEHEMEVVKRLTTCGENDRKYDKVIYVCRKDDVWVTIETPRE